MIRIIFAYANKITIGLIALVMIQILIHVITVCRVVNVYAEIFEMIAIFFVYVQSAIKEVVVNLIGKRLVSLSIPY